jgi:hypothetical protein
MDKPRLLDLFCGAGGAAMGYYRAGFEVVGVDNRPQPHYPFEFIQADALDISIQGFDAYHASPPCEHYSMMQNIEKNKDVHPDLINAIRARLEQTGRPYIIENVYKAPLRGHLMLCGTMFGLKIIRHRFFECPWMPLTLLPPCNHKDVYDPWHGKRDCKKFREAMGIDWMPDAGGGHRVGTVAEAIPPAYTEYIGKYLMEVVNDK